MTDSRPGRYGEAAPVVQTRPQMRTGAGTPVVLTVTITNAAAAARSMMVTALGLESSWLDGPTRTAPVPPGESTEVQIQVAPETGALPARYPFALAVQALDPASGEATASTSLTDLVLTVDAPGSVSVEVVPASSKAVWRQRLAVLLRNTGATTDSVYLESQASSSSPVRLKQDLVEIRPGETVKVHGHIRVAHPQFIGQRMRHAFTITAHGRGAPRRAQGTLTAVPILGPTATKVTALIAVVAVWATLAVLFIPKLADYVHDRQATTATSTHTSPGAQSGNGSGSAEGAGTAGTGSGGDSGHGTGSGAASGGGKKQAASGTAKPAAVQLNGVVQGENPGGVTVDIKPTSLVSQEALQAVPVAFSTPLSGAGKTPAEAVYLMQDVAVGEHRRVVTGDDGAWSFPGVPQPGYYLLTFSKPGYQTQRFIVDSSGTKATKPLEVTMQAGDGSLSGSVAGPDGPVGGATVTITDGTTTITTSSTTTGAGNPVGTWAVDGLSTPSNYLVSVTKQGYGTESKLITVAAGSSAQVTTHLRTGVGSLVGTVSGVDTQGLHRGVGGATVTATNGTVTRTATTVTRGPVGRYTLTDLPVPGTYTVTVSADGYQPQTTKVHFRAGQPQARVDAQLTLSSAVVDGTITTSAGDGLVGVGLVLRNDKNTYKTTTASQPRGAFRFNGVAPGTYVLSSEKFGYHTDYVTVQASAGGTTSIDRTLRAVKGTVLAATARIRGSVQDARTGGPITCPQGESHCITVSVQPTGGTQNERTVRTRIAAGEEYTLPGTKAKGLLPGSYQVTASAPTYEPVTIEVPVALGALVTAPVIQLNPDPVIQGQLRYVVGRPHGVTCVWAIRVTADDQPPACSEPKCASLAEATGPDEPVCALVAGDDTYRMRLPGHGTYTVYIEPSDPEYVAPPPVTLQLGLGEVKQQDALLHRLGRIDVQVLEPGPGGELLASPHAKVMLADSHGKLMRSPRADVDGTFRFDRLQPGTYLVSAKQGTLTSPQTEVRVGLDQEVETSRAVTRAVSAALGRVMYVYDGKPTPVAGADVEIQGITGYDDEKPVYQSVHITTDDHGCFALYTKTVPKGGPCQDLAAGTASAVKQAILSNAVTVRVTADHLTGLPAQKVRLQPAPLINTFTLGLIPVQFRGELEVEPSGPEDLSEASVEVLTSPPGAGDVEVKVSDDGELTWSDSKYGHRIYPGTYQVRAQLHGYTSATETITCLPADGTCGPQHLVLYRKGSLTLTVLEPDDPVPAEGPRVKLRFSGDTDARTVTLDARTHSTTIDGLLPVRPGHAGQSLEHLVVTDAGYQELDPDDLDSVAACTNEDGKVDASAAIRPGEQRTCTVALRRLGAISGQVTGVVSWPDSTPMRYEDLKQATVTAYPCSATGRTEDGIVYCTKIDQSDAFSDTTDANGDYSITGTRAREGLRAGYWWLTVSKKDLKFQAACGHPMTIDQKARCGSTVNLQRANTAWPDATQNPTLWLNRVKLDVQITDQYKQKPENLTVSLRDLGGRQLAVASGGVGGLYHFADVVPGTYWVHAVGDKFNVSETKVTIVRTTKTNQPVVTRKMRVSRGTAIVTGTVNALQGANQQASGLANVTVCVVDADPVDDSTCADPVTGTDGDPLKATTTDNGQYRFTTVPYGDFWVVYLPPAGYKPTHSDKLTFGPAHMGTILSPTLVRVTHVVTVTVTGPDGVDLSGWVTSLIPTDTSTYPNPTLTPPTLAGSDAGTYTVEMRGPLGNGVPFGCWKFGLDKPSGHYGDLSLSEAPSGSDSQCPDGSFWVPETGDEAVSVGYTLDASKVTVRVTATPLSPNLLRPWLAHLSVTQGGDTVADGLTAFVSETQTLWLPNGQGYTFTATPLSFYRPAWKVGKTTGVTVSDGGVNVNVNISENPASVTVQTHGADSDFPQTVTIVYQNGLQPEAYLGGVVRESDDPYTFADLPAGNWTINVSAPGGATSDPVTVTLVGGQNGDDGDGETVQLKEPKFHLDLSVDAGEPLAPDDSGAYVPSTADITVTPKNGNDAVWSKDDAPLPFDQKVDLDAGTYTVSAKATVPVGDTGDGNAVWRADKEVIFPGDSQATLTLAEQPAKVSVNTTGAAADHPLDLSFTFENGLSLDCPTGATCAGRVSDDPVLFDNLPPGGWTFTATDQDGNSTKREVALHSGDNGTITLPDPSPLITFQVEADPAIPDDPIDTVDLVIQHKIGPQDWKAIEEWPDFDLTGTKDLRLLQSETYRVVAIPDDTTTWPKVISDQFTVTKSKTVTVTVSEVAGSLQVQTTGATKQAPQTLTFAFGGAQVVGLCDGDSDPCMRKTDDPSSFDDLVIGSWTVTATVGSGNNERTATCTRDVNNGDTTPIVLPMPTKKGATCQP